MVQGGLDTVSAVTPIKNALAVACDLASNYGIPVFPCKQNKQPLTEHGFHDASTDLDGLEYWWREHPAALAGVPTGRVSRLLVVDIDPDGHEWYRDNAERLACARTHRTPRGGYHLLYRMPAVEIRNSASKLARGVDVRGEGGYVIWWPAHGLATVGDIEDVTEPPAWLIELLTDRSVPSGTHLQTLPSTGGKVANGSRNSTLTSLAGKMRRAGASQPEIETALHSFNGRCNPPLPEQEVARIAASVARYEPSEESQAVPDRAPLNWSALAKITPPARDWIIDHWIPANEVTLLSGPGGIGKTGVAQALASCVAIHREYLDYVPKPRRVLMWAGEDDPGELHRRQIAIAAMLGVDLEEFAGKLFLESYHRTQIDLAVLVQGRLTPSAMLAELREQVGDYGAELVILDNIARLFGGNENDRHQVSAFITMLNHAAEPTNAGIILLGHPAKAAGSEFSGSTAWEGAVRTRLYLGSKLPDEQDDSEAADDSVRYLCRRKANYSTKDWRRIKYVNGVMVPEDTESRSTAPVGPDFAKDLVLATVRKLAAMNEHGNTSTASPNYLPKLAKRYDLLDRLTEKQFGRAMFELVKAGRLTTATVGTYRNRTAKTGLIEVSP
jgi:hypothetical protein